MKNGDDLVLSLTSDAEEINSKVSDIYWPFESQNLIGQKEVENTIDQRVQEIKGLCDQVMDKAAKAKEEYEKIKSLDGVDKYVEYADLMIESLDKLSQSYNLEKSSSDAILGFFKAQDDATADAMSASAKQQDDQSVDLYEEYQELYKKAKNLQSEEKL